MKVHAIRQSFVAADSKIRVVTLCGKNGVKPRDASTTYTSRCGYTIEAIDAAPGNNSITCRSCRKRWES